MNTLIKLILFGLSITWNAKATLCPADSMLEIIQSMPQDSSRLHKIEECRLQIIDTPGEITLLEILLKEAQQQNNIKYQALAYRNRIRYYSNALDKKNAVSVSDSATYFFRKHKLYQSLFETEIMIINLYTWDSEYEYSILKGNEMYEEAKSIDCKEGIISACYTLGYACYASGRYREAASWYKQGIKLIKDSVKTGTELIDLNLVLTENYISWKKTDYARLYLDSVQIHLLNYEETNTKISPDHFDFYRLWIHARKATFYLEDNYPDKAKNELDLARKYTDSTIYDIYKDIMYFAYSDYYLATGDYEKALDALEQGIHIQKKQQREDTSTFLRKKAQIYYKSGDLDLATNYIQKSIRLADSLNLDRFSKQSSQLSSIYEINKLEAEGMKQVQVIRMQILLLIFLCLFTLILGFFFLHFRKIKKQILTAAQQAQHTEQSTSGFLSNLSREIQTFFGEIAHLSDLLIRESRPKERKEFAARLQKQNEIAQLIIFDILDISKIESDRMKFLYEEVNLNGLLNEISSSSLNHVSPECQLTLVPGPDIIFITDAVHLSHILKNLIYYVIIQTKSGKVRFGYTPQKKSIRFFISGNGWIISDETRKTMFDRIAQTSGKLEDINLKMIICKGLITKMGGSINFISDSLSSGFEFILPVRQNTEIN